MSMLEPLFQGRSVETGAIGSLAPPLRGEESLGSMPTARIPGKGFRSTVIPGLNWDWRFFQSRLKYLTNPSGNSGAKAPMVGNSLPGRLKLNPNGLGVILRIRISITSPGSAPLTYMGPVTECGPPPGLALRKATISSIDTPGWILSWECIMVSTDTISPELTVSLGDSLGSSHPHWVVSKVAASRWRFGPACAGLASPAFRRPVSSPTATDSAQIKSATTG